MVTTFLRLLESAIGNFSLLIGSRSTLLAAVKCGGMRILTFFDEPPHAHLLESSRPIRSARAGSSG